MSEDILTKSQFARLIKRDPAFVTRAIDSGKLAGAALIGEGRTARIHVATALSQLAITLDLGQQLAQAAPILPAVAQAPAVDLFAAGPSMAAEAGEVPASGLHAERDEQIRLRNEKLRDEIERQRRADRLAEGELVVAAEVAAAVRRQIAPLVGAFDELPAVIAKGIAERFGLAYPEVLIEVKSMLRSQRMAWADRATAMGAEAVEAVEVAA